VSARLSGTTGNVMVVIDMLSSWFPIARWSEEKGVWFSLCGQRTGLFAPGMIR
jgi:hypothetical protein